MASLAQRFRAGGINASAAQLERSFPTISLDQWVQSFSYNGLSYDFIPRQTLLGGEERIEEGWEGLVQGVYRSNGIVFACMLARAALFSEARFQFRRTVNGRPGKLFGTPALGILEHPGGAARPTMTTGDLMLRAIQDVDLVGNWFGVVRGDQVRRLRPDWVLIVSGVKRRDASGKLTYEGVNDEYNQEIIDYVYYPGGMGSGEEPILLGPKNVAHWAGLTPDPSATYRGMSWITPVIREIMGDNAATSHKLQFFEKGATPNLVISVDPEVNLSDKGLEKLQAKLSARHEGVENAYRTLLLGRGATAQVVGNSLEQIDFKNVQGAGETRISAAAGVPPVIAGFSEGLAAATYANYSQARRRFADGTMRPLWRNFVGSIANLVRIPDGAELWYDDRDIAFLQEDQKDRSEILKTDAITVKTLIDSGFEPDSVIDAVVSNDLSILAQTHSGLFSVQLHPANTVKGDVVTGNVVPAGADAPELPAADPAPAGTKPKAKALPAAKPPTSKGGSNK